MTPLKKKDVNSDLISFELRDSEFIVRCYLKTVWDLNSEHWENKNCEMQTQNSWCKRFQ